MCGNGRDGVLDESLVYGTYRNIPYIGSFCNEPGYGKTVNVDLHDAGSTERLGYKDMKLVSTRFIEKGEVLITKFFLKLISIANYILAYYDTK